MIFKKKEFFLLIFLILLQSCSGGRIGNFLESSFKDLEKTNQYEDFKKNLANKGIVIKGNKEIDDKKNKIDSNYKNTFWSDTSSLRKTFKFEDGSIIELNDQMLELPMMIFYPSGENSGGQIDIYHSNYIQRLIIFSNGQITDEIISY